LALVFINKCKIVTENHCFGLVTTLLSRLGSKFQYWVQDISLPE
jgi:hypothetical protein